MISKIKLASLLLILLTTNSHAGINEKQKTIIKANLFLIEEGMISKKEVFEKAKLFDSNGFFGINSDRMTETEFNNFIKKENEFEELLEDESLNSEN